MTHFEVLFQILWFCHLNNSAWEATYEPGFQSGDFAERVDTDSSKSRKHCVKYNIINMISVLPESYDKTETEVQRNRKIAQEYQFYPLF